MSSGGSRRQGGSLAPALLVIQTRTVIRFHRWRKSPCALAQAHPVAHVHPVKSASSPAFLRAQLPEECKAREGKCHRDAWPVSSPDRRHLVDPEPDERYVGAFPACTQLRHDRYERSRRTACLTLTCLSCFLHLLASRCVVTTPKCLLLIGGLEHLRVSPSTDPTPVPLIHLRLFADQLFSEYF